MEWRERAYKEALQRGLAGLEARRRRDPTFAISDAEGTLKDLYVQEGLDMGSRGMVQEAVLAATIAAYEQFIDTWKGEALSPPRSRP
jgi:hypothetical protein